jgi:hypothetical protein
VLTSHDSHQPHQGDTNHTVACSPGHDCMCGQRTAHSGGGITRTEMRSDTKAHGSHIHSFMDTASVHACAPLSCVTSCAFLLCLATVTHSHPACCTLSAGIHSRRSAQNKSTNMTKQTKRAGPTADWVGQGRPQVIKLTHRQKCAAHPYILERRWGSCLILPHPGFCPGSTPYRTARCCRYTLSSVYNLPNALRARARGLTATTAWIAIKAVT